MLVNPENRQIVNTFLFTLLIKTAMLSQRYGIYCSATQLAKTDTELWLRTIIPIILGRLVFVELTLPTELFPSFIAGLILLFMPYFSENRMPLYNPLDLWS